MKLFISLLLGLLVLVTTGHAETIEIASNPTRDMISINAGESDFVDVYIYNLGNVDVKIGLRLSNMPEMKTHLEPNETILRAEKTKTPYSDPDIHWYLMEDGETYAPGKKIRFFVEAPTESDTLYAGIFSAMLAIEAHALDTDGENVRATIGYEHNYPLKIQLLTAPRPYSRDINLSYGDTSIEQNSRDEKRNEETTTKYTPLVLNSTFSSNKNNSSEAGFSLSTFLILFGGILVLFYLLKR